MGNCSCLYEQDVQQTIIPDSDQVIKNCLSPIDNPVPSELNPADSKRESYFPSTDIVTEQPIKALPLDSGISLSYFEALRYHGQRRKGRRNGFGRMFYLDGGMYEGWWKDDEYHGYGMLKNAKNEVYLGDWV